MNCPSSNHRPPPFVLGLDIGSSGTRAGLFDSKSGEIPRTQARIPKPLRATSPGCSEESAEELLIDVVRCIDQVLVASADLSTPIDLVAISCFWHSLVGVDLDGRAVTPLFGWSDTRANGAAEFLRMNLDEKEFHSRTGCRFHSSYWPAKMTWLRNERSEVFQRAAKWVSFGEFVFLKLFGKSEASISMASGTGLFDQRTCSWDHNLLKALGIAREQLPEIAGVGRSFTGLTPNYLRRWPALRNARWYPAIGDGAANNIGAGATTRGDVALMIGTSGAMRVLWEGLPPSQVPEALWCYRADAKRVLIGGALSDGGVLYEWMTNSFLLTGGTKDVERELASMEPDSHGLTVMPFWAGERSTGWSLDARGAILGLTLHTKSIEIVQAGMEAVAYRFAILWKHLSGTVIDAAITASGNALHGSRTWTQMVADVLGLPVRVSAVREASTRGAVLLALNSEGSLNSLSGTGALFTETFEPDSVRHGAYLAGLERHEKLYERVIADETMAGIINGRI